MDRSDISLFISHSSSDKSIVRAVADQLAGLGYDVWLDERKLALGDRLHATIERAISEADFLIVFLSNSALASFWVDEEWRSKFDEQLQGGGVKVIPVLLESCDLPLSLQGRLQLRLPPYPDLLSTGHLEIDAAILDHVARGPNFEDNPESDSIRKTSANMREELKDRLGRWSGKGTDCRQLHEVLVAQRISAMVAYDSGDRDMAISSYGTMIALMATNNDVWDVEGPMRSQSQRIRQDCSELLAGPLRRDAWAVRMVLDEAIEFVQARCLLFELQESIDRTLDSRAPRGHLLDRFAPSPGNTLMYCYMFDPVRYAVQADDRAPFNSSEILCSLCDSTIRILESRLRSYDRGRDLHNAVILRMLRWPGLGGEYSGSRRAQPGEKVANPVQVLNDVYGMGMSGFQAEAVFGLDWGSVRSAIVRVGSARLFDAALSQRGYDRDGPHWGKWV